MGIKATDQSYIRAKAISVSIVLLLVTAVVWAYFAEVDEITRGAGKVIPASKTQIVQAAETGVVDLINVKVGQFVKKGSLIARLDDTTMSSSLGETMAQKLALEAKLARLEAEQTGLFDTAFTCPETVRSTSLQICENEERLLRARKDNFTNTLEVLQQRKIQREKELDETLASIEQLQGDVELAKQERDLLKPLVESRLAAKTDFLRVERHLNESEGKLQVARASVERIKGAIEEASLQVNELSLQAQKEALNEKTQTLASLAVLEETARGGQDRVARTDIRSPVDGIVNSLAINTIGAFVQSGTVVAEVVPTSQELLVEARISPNDVAFVQSGQKALVKISAYDFSIYGGLSGAVETVTADSLVDPTSGAPYFQVLLKTDKSFLEKDSKTFNISPGMICTVDIITGRKSILNYLLKPINKARQVAMTER
ncbi:HlyD family type I secretion periplasmic adaptor subunit [Cohaesibacter haloalkalitolerans]|uniref:HlyD family type I secretion periplasmic adaptor subunit n=1 Tax=Cohaesibacter haloalkalitolerans TaxID=1162980 RepID=UPI001FE19C8D|nr:HlyD family type I secretion periplasmic adaptor subunit [Cohaesibacter haloalkalitolerans]